MRPVRAALAAALLASLPGFAGAADAPPAAVSPLAQDELLREFLWEEFIALPPGRRPKVGVAFSGGAARGYGHVGVIEGLENTAFPVDTVAGTSMGSIVGAIFADGMSSSRMLDLVVGAPLTEGVNLSAVRVINLLLTDKLLSTRPVEAFLNKHLGDKRFYQLKRPFACVATDMKTGEKIVFSEGEVAPAVRASINIPGVFAPVEYRHRYLVDGGLVQFIPVEEARQLGADWVLASVTEGDYTRSTFPNVFFALTQAIDISGAILARRSKQAADYVIEPDVGAIKIYEFERGGEAYEKGVLASAKRLKGAREALLVHSAGHLSRHLTGAAR